MLVLCCNAVLYQLLTLLCCCRSKWALIYDTKPKYGIKSNIFLGFKNSFSDFRIAQLYITAYFPAVPVSESPTFICKFHTFSVMQREANPSNLNQDDLILSLRLYLYTSFFCIICKTRFLFCSLLSYLIELCLIGNVKLVLTHICCCAQGIILPQMYTAAIANVANVLTNYIFLYWLDLGVR